MKKTEATSVAEQMEPTTLAGEAYVRLREDIVSGLFPAGEPLRLEALKARYGYSFSPLREALNRLSTERLVELSALRGFRTAPLSLDEMWDAIETRILIESQALRLSILNGGVDWEASVVAAFYSFSRLAHAAEADRGTSSQELERRHHDFHFALIAASGSRWLHEIAGQLYAQTERYRRPMLKTSGDKVGKRNVVAEHKELMDVTLARDEAAAVDLLGQHYRRTGKAIEAGFLPRSNAASAEMGATPSDKAVTRRRRSNSLAAD